MVISGVCSSPRRISVPTLMLISARSYMLGRGSIRSPVRDDVLGRAPTKADCHRESCGGLKNIPTLIRISLWAFRNWLAAWEFRCRTSLDPSSGRSDLRRIVTLCGVGSRGCRTCWREPTWRWQRWLSPPDSQIKVTFVGTSENSSVCLPDPFECSIANRTLSCTPARLDWLRRFARGTALGSSS
jgi:hypothetical protein